MKTKFFSTKKNTAIICMTCVLVVIAALGFFLGVISNTSPLKLAQPQYSYVVDINNPKELAGLVDYVFVGRVETRHKVQYEDIFTRGLETIGTPYTSYDVIVLENLKGNLRRNETISVVKQGGVAMNGKILSIAEGDFLPDEKDVCVFFVSVQEDGSLLIAGTNCNVKIMESSLTKQVSQKMSVAQVQQAEQSELHAITSSSIYQRMAAACKSEVLFERERYAAPSELLEIAALN